jgi:hypothetical protein
MPDIKACTQDSSDQSSIPRNSTQEEGCTDRSFIHNTPPPFTTTNLQGGLNSESAALLTLLFRVCHVPTWLNQYVPCANLVGKKLIQLSYPGCEITPVRKQTIWGAVSGTIALCMHAVCANLFEQKGLHTQHTESRHGCLLSRSITCTGRQPLCTH